MVLFKIMEENKEEGLKYLVKYYGMEKNYLETTFIRNC